MFRLYDSLKKETLPFLPADGKAYRIYACGPTVYNDLTVGNLRTFLTVDLLRRYLEYRDPEREARLVMNITDVGHMVDDADSGEDKILKSAREEGVTPQAIIDRYTDVFFNDIDAIGIKRAWKHPKATGHIPEMIELVGKLLDEGKAYATEKGDVYYDVSSFNGYGKLSGNTVEDLVAGARVEPSPDKRNPADFALWIHNPKHVMKWDVPERWKKKYPRWKPGYPGWHLECSAMAMKYLGETIDLHIGGEDLKFPHHECEIAQSEGATGKPFALRWLHVSHLMVEGEKMSKSKGNFYTLSDLTARGFSPEAVRYLLLSAHYRSQLNFTMKGLEEAEDTVAALQELAVAYHRRAGRHQASVFERRFIEVMDDDLNVSAALAVIHDFVRAVRKKGVTESETAEFLSMIEDVFGLGLFKKKGRLISIDVSDSVSVEDAAEVQTDTSAMLEARKVARERKDWSESDRLRDELSDSGYIVEDTPDGQRLKKK